jgi:hypothetical protein
MADIVIRGNVVRFSTTFFAADGNPVTPDSASVAIKTAPAAASITLTMSNNAGTWTALWDTTDVAPGLVFWCITAVNPAASDEGEFPLEANFANAP